MNKLFKKLAVLLSFVLVFTAMPMSVFAEGTVVAKIGETEYTKLADALSEAQDGATVELVWSESDAAIAMNGAVYGKTVTITGTAAVDWSKGNLFVGRGGEGNGKVIFDNANLTSASNSASYGIHVSGREKDTTDKYDGTLVINNSTIELDYLINKGTMTLDNSTLTVKNGFSVGGRPASETESGEDATATLTLNNGSKVVVNNHNGMGLGYEAIGVMNVNSGSAFECTQAFLVTAKGTMNVNGGTVKVDGTLTTNKNLFISGNSTVQIANLSGRATVLDDTVLTNSYIKSETNGTTRVLGDLELKGGFDAAYIMTAGSAASTSGYNGTITIEDGTTLNASYGVEMNGNLTLNGGTLELSGGNKDGAIWGMVFQNGTFEINTDLNVDGNGATAPIYFTNANATINSTVTQSNSGGEPMYIKESSAVTLGTAAEIDTLSVHGAGELLIDGSGLTAGEYANIKCGTSGFTGEIKVINNETLAAEKDGVKIMLKNVVAKIGDAYYETLAAAVAAAESEDEITLLKDVALTEALLLDKSVTINGGNHKVSSNASRAIRVTISNINVELNDLTVESTAVRTGNSDIRGISVDPDISGVTLTLNNCAVDFTDASASDWAYGINICGNSSNHIITVNGGSYEGANAINVWGSNHTITVDGASVTSLYKASEWYVGTCVRLEGTGTALTLKNNTFEGQHAIACGETTVGSNTITKENNTDNTQYYTVMAGDKFYYVIEGALANSQAGTTIKLINDVTLTDTVVIDKSITLDKNDKTLTGTFELATTEAVLTADSSITVNSGVVGYIVSESNNEYKLVKCTSHTSKVDKEAVAPKCEETGLTEGTICSKCNTVLNAQTTVPATGHAYGDWTVTTAPKCEAAGVETRVCANDAAHTETREVAATGHTFASCSYDDVNHYYKCACGKTYLTGAHEDADNNAICEWCGYVMVSGAAANRQNPNTGVTAEMLGR